MMCLALLVHVGEIAIRFPCNHANKLMFQYEYFVAGLTLLEVVLSVLSRKICVLFWLLLIASFSIPVIEDKCNIMVPYETWADRGMPDWGERCRNQ